MERDISFIDDRVVDKHRESCWLKAETYRTTDLSKKKGHIMEVKRNDEAKTLKKVKGTKKPGH